MEKVHSLFLTSQSSPLLPFPSPKRLRLRDCYSCINVRAELQEIRVCTNRTCRKQGSFQTLETLTGLAPPNVVVKSCGCLGKCGGGPNLAVLPDGVIFSHCGTVARATEVMVSLFAGKDCCDSYDAKNSLDALTLRKRAEVEFEKQNFSEAEHLLSQVGCTLH